MEPNKFKTIFVLARKAKIFYTTYVDEKYKSSYFLNLVLFDEKYGLRPTNYLPAVSLN